MDFEGGSFVWNDPAPKGDKDEKQEKEEEEFDEYEIVASSVNEYYTLLNDKIRRACRVLTPYNLTRGSDVIFSSGWENTNKVEKITSGTRYAVPCFLQRVPCRNRRMKG